MNRIESLFQQKEKDLLSVYFSAGFPKLEDTLSIMEYLQKGGADLIEVGIPFSDPLADGPTIQQSNQKALENGITLALIFEQLARMREKVEIPVLLMGYLNPVVQYGVERFCAECQKVGVDGLILPDLPMAEYLEEYQPLFERYGLINVFLITPQTSEKRIREIDRLGKGFIYMVSSASTTGAKSGISREQIAYFERVQSMDLQTPRMIGFGISNHETFSQACAYAQGAIIGSAFIKLLEQSNALEQDITTFIQSVKGNIPS